MAVGACVCKEVVGDGVRVPASARTGQEHLCRHVTEMGLHILGNGELLAVSPLGMVWSELHSRAIPAAGAQRMKCGSVSEAGRPVTIDYHNPSQGRRSETEGRQWGWRAGGVWDAQDRKIN